MLQGTELHVADQIASAAELVLGPFGGVPAVVVRGVAFARSDDGARAGLMPPSAISSEARRLPTTSG